MLGILITQCAPVPKGAIFMFDGSPPAGWQVLTDFNGRFPLGDSIGGILGGDSVHNHILSGTTSVASVWGCIPGSISPTHAHSYNISTNPSTHLPPYRTFIFAKAISPMEYLPRNAIIISYNPPYSSEFRDITDSILGRFPRGDLTAGNVGGSLYHNHSFNGSVDGVITYGGGCDYSPDYLFAVWPLYSHTHNCAGFTDASLHLPPYRTVRFWKVVSDSIRIDSCALIYMFDTIPPCAYLNVDTLFIGKFLRADTVTGLNGGSYSHTHSYSVNCSSFEGDPMPSTYGRSEGTPVSHNHRISGVSHDASNIPPYRTVVFSIANCGLSVKENKVENYSAYRVYNVDGKTVHYGKGKIELKGLPRGVYFIILYDGKKVYSVRKFIKR